MSAFKIHGWGYSARRTEHRSRDSMGYTARLRVPRNEAMYPKHEFLEGLIWH